MSKKILLDSIDLFMESKDQEYAIEFKKDSDAPEVQYSEPEYYVNQDPKDVEKFKDDKKRDIEDNVVSLEPTIDNETSENKTPETEKSEHDPEVVPLGGDKFGNVQQASDGDEEGADANLFAKSKFMQEVIKRSNN